MPIKHAPQRFEQYRVLEIQTVRGKWRAKMENQKSRMLQRHLTASLLTLIHAINYQFGVLASLSTLCMSCLLCLLEELLITCIEDIVLLIGQETIVTALFVNVEAGNIIDQKIISLA